MNDSIITSKDNPRIKKLVKLNQKSKFRKQEGAYILEGRKPVEEALKLGRASEIYYSKSAYDEYAQEIYSDEAEVYVIDDRLYSYVTDTVTPQGILAVVKIDKSEYNDIYSKNSIIFLDEVRDPGNIGTIIRTAEGAGFDCVMLSEGCADVYQPKVVRSTMGSVLRVPIVQCEDDTSSELNNLKNTEYTLYAADLDGAVGYDEPAYEGKTVVIIGNESKGVSDEAKILSDMRISIPMAGEVESLNAAISAGIIMYKIKEIKGGRHGCNQSKG